APDEKFTLNGVFLTHAHMGHYAGLVHFGYEAVGTKDVFCICRNEPRRRNYPLRPRGPSTRANHGTGHVVVPIA
ncbi:MAG: hypothetical protein O7C61_11035, partial [SAR324 cluster bacterium]|nr:hypothetical protein [SAR324 cluster bacterium]